MTSVLAVVPEWDRADRMLKALRVAGATQTEMAAFLGVSRQSVNNWLTGKIEPDVRTLRVWAMRCGVPFEWLRDGEVVRRQGLEPRTR